MRGNDIVDIKLAAKESNWQRKGWLEKIFTPQEQSYIKQAPHAEKIVWTLWSMKESAYKIYTRQYGDRFFAPQKFNCNLLTDSTGTVTIGKIVYPTTTSITNNYIYSVANFFEFTTLPPADYLFFCDGNSPAFQQQMIYKKLIAEYAISAGAGKEVKYLSIIKNKNGTPFIHYKNEQLNIPVSITHHGNYGAFTIN